MIPTLRVRPSGGLRFSRATQAAPLPPGQPSNLRLAADPPEGGVVELVWDAPASGGAVSSYEVLRDESVIVSGVEGTSATDESVQEGETYSYTVRAIGPGGTGPESSALEVEVPSPSGLGTINDLAAVPGNGQVSLSWTPAVNAAGHRADYRQGASGTWTEGSLLAANASAAVISGLTNGVEYQFRVVAGIDELTYTISNEVSATPEVPVGLGTITNLSATPGDGQVSLSWSAADNATSHQPQYRAGTSGTWLDFGSALGGSASGVTVTGLTNDQLYQFRVVASDGSDTEISNTASATPAEPAEPSELYPNRPTTGGAWTEVGRNDGSVVQSGGAFGFPWMGNWRVASGTTVADAIEVVSDPTNPAGSGQALRLTWRQSTNPRCAQADGSFPADYEELYIMLRLFYEPGWTFGSKMFYLGNPNGTSIYLTREANGDMWLYNQGGGSPLMVIETDDVADGGVIAGNHPLETLGVWYNIELYLRSASTAGGSDGQARAWVNNVLVGSRDGVRWGSGRGFGFIEYYADANSVPSVHYERIGELLISGRGIV